MNEVELLRELTRTEQSLRRKLRGNQQQIRELSRQIRELEEHNTRVEVQLDSIDRSRHYLEAT